MSTGQTVLGATAKMGGLRWPTLYVLFGLLAITAATSALSLPGTDNNQIAFDVDPAAAAALSSGGRCVQPSPRSPHAGSSYFDSDGFRNLSQHRLSTAITHRTESYDDFGNPDPSGDDEDEPVDPRWQTFPPFHKFLTETYPLVHEHAKLEQVGVYSLVYTLQGSTEAKPLLLAAHQDVVPASVALNEWVHPPFEGYFDGEWIWGRGSSDCKSNLIGILSAVERLLETGFKPKRTIILAFGQDEEASGKFGAFQIGKLLENRYGRNGVDLILDEGGLGLSTEFGPLIALPALTEKGYADVSLSLHTTGGHSSVPSKHSAIGYLSRFVVAFEDTPLYRPTLTTSNPYYAYLECVAEHGDEDKVPEWLPDALDRGDLDSLAKQAAAQDLQTRYLLQTSNAATVFRGGVKVNALPEEAQAMFNSRIQINSSVDDHLGSLQGVFSRVADEFDLRLISRGRELTKGAMGTVYLDIEDSSEPSPVTSFKSRQWSLFSQAIRAAFGSDTIASPSLSTSNTDTRNYWHVSDTIIRWTPARVGTRLNAHTVNERIMLSTHVEAVKFYHELVLTMDDAA